MNKEGRFYISVQLIDHCVILAFLHSQMHDLILTKGEEAMPFL